MDLDEVETTEKKTKKKDKKKRTAAEVEADIGNNLAVHIPDDAACSLLLIVVAWQHCCTHSKQHIFLHLPHKAPNNITQVNKSTYHRKCNWVHQCIAGQL